MGYCGAIRNGENIPRHTIRNILTHDFVLVFLAFFVFLTANHSLISTLSIFVSRLGSNGREIGALVGLFLG